LVTRHTPTCGTAAAGINRNSAAEDTPEGEWDATFAVNTKGVFLCCQVRLVRGE
jgi:NAD(P)-dependent dehydrogenase (short-subunit alcohol dehydrogenase family)